mgnify:CR=1 FL=1
MRRQPLLGLAVVVVLGLTIAIPKAIAPVQVRGQYQISRGSGPFAVSTGEHNAVSQSSARAVGMASPEARVERSVMRSLVHSANATYVMNVIDYLNGREDIAIMRGKQQRFNPLDDAAASTRTFVKTLNIVGLPALVVLFGIAVWFRRHGRKKNIQMMFNRSGVQG